jgi:ATP-dependent exoDNAse (exonuclease V) alpha subunit
VRTTITARPTLSKEQREMVERLVTEGDRIAIVIGQAGTGKTFALAAAREAWEASGIPVQGAAVARRAARELTEGAGIDATSIAALLRRTRLGLDLLPPRCVLVVDEAGMLPTRDLAEVMEAVTAVDGKLVLVGDHRQLPELEAGGCFRGLSLRLPAIRLGENRRQTAVWERRALRQLRDGDVAVALAEYKQHDRLVRGPDAETLRGRLVADWWASGGPEGGMMIALRRTDVRDLNRLGRIAMREAARLSGPELSCGTEPFAAGDVVVMRVNDPRLGVANGDRGTVQSVERDSLGIVVRGELVTVDAEYLRRVTPHGDPAIAHGYAVTGHVAQGLTAERAFVLSSDALYREWAYTAMSRGRTLNRLYTLESVARPRDEFAPAIRRARDADVLARLRTSRAQVLASDSGDEPDNRIATRLRAIADERAEIEAMHARQPLPRWRPWRRPSAAGPEKLANNRLVELREEEAQLRAQIAAGKDGSSATRRSVDRDSLQRQMDQELGQRAM